MGDKKKKQNPAKVSLRSIRESQKKNRRKVNEERTNVILRATSRGDLASDSTSNQMKPYKVNKNRK